MKKILLILSTAVLFTYCSQSAGSKEPAGSFNLDSVKAAISAANNSFSEAVAKGDSVGCAALYTKDACMVHPDQNTCGTAAITGFFSAGFTQMGVKVIKLTTSSVTGGKELVAEEGNFELMGADGKTLEKGKYTVLWKEEAGKWKIYRDIAMADTPPAAPEKK
ncbi:MAG: nuclear transport factor 2 family protein [Bacteroidota bacterium]